GVDQRLAVLGGHDAQHVLLDDLLVVLGVLQHHHDVGADHDRLPDDLDVVDLVPELLVLLLALGLQLRAEQLPRLVGLLRDQREVLLHRRQHLGRRHLLGGGGGGGGRGRRRSGRGGRRRRGRGRRGGGRLRRRRGLGLPLVRAVPQRE